MIRSERFITESENRKIETLCLVNQDNVLIENFHETLFRKMNERLLDEATFNISSIYHSICPDEVRENPFNVGRVLITDEELYDDNISDTWDGHLMVQENSVIRCDGDKYRVFDLIKQDEISCFYKCQGILDSKKFVGIKVLKKNNVSRELENIQRLADESISHPGKNCCDNYKSIFTEKGHTCMLYDLSSYCIADSISQKLPLMELLEQIRYLMKQMLKALSYIHSKGLIHSDIRPECMRFTDDSFKKTILTDFETALNNPANSSPIKQSRIYRSPEIILGLQFNETSDIWAIGCITAEFYLDFALFACDSDLDEISAISSLVGPISSDIIVLSPFWYRFFDAALQGFTTKADPLYVFKEKHQFHHKFENLESISFEEIIKHHKQIQSPEEDLIIDSFVDFLKGMLKTNPDERFSAEQALDHPFIAGEKFTGSFTPKPDNRTLLYQNEIDKRKESEISANKEKHVVTNDVIAEDEFLSMF